MTKRLPYSPDFIALNSDVLPELKAATKHGKRSKWEAKLDEQLQAAGLYDLLAVEYRFCDCHGSRFDYALPDRHIAFEVDGGNRMAAINKRTGQPFAVGRHTQADDYRKLNHAAMMGWRVMRFTPEMITSGEAVAVISEVVLPL